jgi:calcineurin-like phosphoesterase family protein
MRLWGAFILLSTVIASCLGQQRQAGPANPTNASPAAAPTQLSDNAVQTVIAAGDIVDCKNLSGSESTAKLIDSIPGTVLPVGDLAYPDGSDENFKCYDKTWGRHKARTRPAPGNHEYHTPGAAGYYKYFGNAAGDPGKGYYSFDLGSWHIIALNSQCDAVGGCQKGSPQEQWLSDDLRKNSSNCILAFWHVPLFSSGDEHGNATAMKPFWDDLYAAGADIVLNGHDHDYERFAPQNADGAADPARGIREFVVGTGGKSQRGFRTPSAASEARSNSTFGVLRIDLQPQGYSWKFIPVAGGTFTDSGSGTCHVLRPAKASR